MAQSKSLRGLQDEYMQDDAVSLKGNPAGEKKPQKNSNLVLELKLLGVQVIAADVSFAL